MVDEVPTDQRTSDMEKGQVHLCAPLVPDAQAAVAVQPGERALDHPPVSAESLAALDATPGDAWRDAPLAQLLAQRLRVIGPCRRAASQDAYAACPRGA